MGEIIWDYYNLGSGILQEPDGSGQRLSPSTAKGGMKVSSTFSKVAGFGTESRGLDLRVALKRQNAGQYVRRQVQARQWHKDSAAKDASRANPLSWEIKDFPSHGEPQTVCRSVAALDLTGRCCLW